MRFREYSLALSQIMLSIVIVSIASPAPAQFREVAPDKSASINADGDLVPTSQPFVPPNVAPKATAAKVESEPVVDTAALAESAEEVPEVEAPPKQVEPMPAVTEADALVGEVEASNGETTPSADVTASDDAEDAIDISPSFKPGTPSDPTANGAAQVAPLTFNDVEPGVTTIAYLKSIWGEPLKTVEDELGQILIYDADGFRQVDVHPDESGQTVQSILLHLNEAQDLATLQEQLGLQEFEPVTIPDEAGQPLAQGFPERGVLMTVEEGDPQQILQVSLEVIQSELFRLRAEHDLKHQDQRSLADLEEATRLEPEDAKAYWLQAELLDRAGRSKDAMASAKIALRIEPRDPLYRLTVARLSAANGQLEDGVVNTRSVLDDPDSTVIVQARAEYQLGNLTAIGPEPSFEDALAHHMKAIEMAAKEVANANVDVRRMAKDILVDAHLAVAQDIALGNFQRKREVVPKWLTRATQLAEDFISRDAGDETIRMEVYRTTLAIYSVMEGNFDASIATEEALNEGRRLIAAANDKIYQSRVERELSEALLHAAKVEHRRGRGVRAMNYASNSVALLEHEDSQQQPSLFDRIMHGQLYFMLGSLYAIHREDHQEAVKWYEKAKPMFDDERLTNLVDGTGFGDLFVSMGVSYWEVGEKEKAVQMTQIGAELMQHAVQIGSLDLMALSVPYGNLAAMHTNLGNGTEAKHFAEMMARVEKEAAVTR